MKANAICLHAINGLIQSMCNKRMCNKVFMERGRGGCVMINTSADEMRAH